MGISIYLRGHARITKQTFLQNNEKPNYAIGDYPD